MRIFRAGVDVVVPEPAMDLVTRRVLVMTYEGGFKVTDTALLDQNAIDRLSLIRKIAQVCTSRRPCSRMPSC
jgi:predicted unusual protein kinase regulating ubiquinone biosynthesis (AarF/ABC1/UbiB family)